MEKKGIMKRDFDFIKVYRKTIFGWMYVTILNRWDEDGLTVLHRTRDHYRNLWGYKKVKLVLVWNDEPHIY